MQLKNSEEWKLDNKGKSKAFFSLKKPVIVNKEMINELVEISKNDGNKNIRLCLHSSPEESLHDMIILEYKDKKCRKAHKHSDKDETLVMLYGKMLVMLFDEQGELIYKNILDAENNRVYRNARNKYHAYLPTSDFVIYKETKQGPFKQTDNIPPNWNHTEILKKYLSVEQLICHNTSCSNPCQLNIRFNQPANTLS